MTQAPSEPKRTWPRFVLGGAALFFLVTAFWIYREMQRVKWMKAQRVTNSVFSTPLRQVTKTDMSWTNGMVWIPGGTFWMGSEEGQADEKPVHEVTVDGFWIDETEVT